MRAQTVGEEDEEESEEGEEEGEEDPDDVGLSDGWMQYICATSLYSDIFCFNDAHISERCTHI